jgi:hypothetical protein
MKRVLLHFVIIASSTCFISCVSDKSNNRGQDASATVSDSHEEVAEYEAFNSLTKEITGIRERSACFDHCYAPRMEHRGPACEKFNTTLKAAFSGKNSQSADFESPAIKSAGRVCRRESTKQSLQAKTQCLSKCPDSRL